MPIYIYKNPETGEVAEVFQEMNEPHVFFYDGVEWDRVFTSPNTFIKDSPIDPMKPKDFMRLTQDKKDTMGDLFDRSAELSEQRKDRYGEDPVKKAADEKWSKERGGKKLAKKIKDLEVKI